MSESQSEEEIKVLKVSSLLEEPTRSSGQSLSKLSIELLGESLVSTSEESSDSPVEEEHSIEKEVEIPMCELRKSKKEEETTVAAKLRLIRSK